jgi:AcrR family transcriptional regulator
MPERSRSRTRAQRLAFREGEGTTTEPRKRPRQSRSQQTVEALLEATARVLAKHSYDDVTTKEIARVAGVSAGSLYQYFPSKAALVAALLEQRTQADLEKVFAAAAANAGASIEERLRAGIAASIEVYRNDLPLYRALLRNAPRIGRVETMRANVMRGRKGLEAMIASTQGEHRELDPELGAFVLSSAIEWVILSCVLEAPERLDDPRLVDEIVALAVGYLRPIAENAITG